jgi:catechol 2,3-dioxygenase-like lactoylglutathione lyase family enzyme
MIDHVGLNVSDLAAAKAFYAETLEPLGHRIWAEGGAFVLDPDGNNSEAVLPLPRLAVPAAALSGATRGRWEQTPSGAALGQGGAART